MYIIKITKEQTLEEIACVVEYELYLSIWHLKISALQACVTCKVAESTENSQRRLKSMTCECDTMSAK